MASKFIALLAAVVVGALASIGSAQAACRYGAHGSCGSYYRNNTHDWRSRLFTRYTGQPRSHRTYYGGTYAGHGSRYYGSYATRRYSSYAHRDYGRDRYAGYDGGYGGRYYGSTYAGYTGRSYARSDYGYYPAYYTERVQWRAPEPRYYYYYQPRPVVRPVYYYVQPVESRDEDCSPWWW